MYLDQDKNQGNFFDIIEQLKIDTILRKYPEKICKPQEIKKQLQYIPTITYPLERGVRLRLISAEKNEPRNYWYNQIGHEFNITQSIGGMENHLIDTSAGNIRLNKYDKTHRGLIFEIIALPLKLGNYMK